MVLRENSWAAGSFLLGTMIGCVATATDSPSVALSTGSPVRIVEGSDPICSMLEDPAVAPSNREDQPKWSDSAVDLQALTTQESIFDFYNDGKLARVFMATYSDHYMDGNTLLVQAGKSATKVDVAITNPLDDPNAWYLPCQFESSSAAIKDCPPFSQNNDEAGLSASLSQRAKVLRFRGRYSHVIPWRNHGITYLLVTATSKGMHGYEAVLTPLPGKLFKLTCLIKVRPAG